MVKQSRDDIVPPIGQPLYTINAFWQQTYRWSVVSYLIYSIKHTGVYFKLGIMDPTFIWHPNVTWALYSWSNGFSSLIFTYINRSVISAAYYTSNKYFRGLFKTPLALETRRLIE